MLATDDLVAAVLLTRTTAETDREARDTQLMMMIANFDEIVQRLNTVAASVAGVCIEGALKRIDYFLEPGIVLTLYEAPGTPMTGRCF